MSELIAARGGDPVDVLFDVLIEENGSVPTVFFHHSEQDMQLVHEAAVDVDRLRRRRRQS